MLLPGECELSVNLQKLTIDGAALSRGRSRQTLGDKLNWICHSSQFDMEQPEVNILTAIVHIV